MNKPGWKTSEFWLSAGAIAGIAASVLTGIACPWCAAVAGGIASVYTLARTIAKAKGADVGAVAPIAQPAPPTLPPALGRR